MLRHIVALGISFFLIGPVHYKMHSLIKSAPLRMLVMIPINFVIIFSMLRLTAKSSSSAGTR